MESRQHKLLNSLAASASLLTAWPAHRPGRIRAADSHGKWCGLDVDVWRAIAAVVLADREKVKYLPLNAQQRFTALQSGEIDVLSRNTTFMLTLDASIGLSMTVGTYPDGQGSWLRRSPARPAAALGNRARALLGTGDPAVR